MVVGRNIEDPEQGRRGDLTYNMSKNSVLILNVSPKADGTILEKAQHPPGDGVLTYGQRQGDLRYNSVDRRR